MFTFLEYIANKSISKKLIEKIGKYKIYSVDASEIRSLCQADDQFNHFGGHKEFKFIPDNEIWISNDISKHERFFLIQSGINQYERKGKDWYEYALRKEKAEREKVDGIKFDPKEKPPQALYYKHFCNIGDVNVWLINGEVCRDIYKTDGIEGFNPEIYPWVPKNEIWVEKNLKSIDVIATVLHEYIESSLMKLKKMSYAKAHNIASKIDFQHRGKFDIKDIEALNRKKALEMAKEIEIMDFQFVTNRLATGATIPDISGVEILIKAGITHIINCQAEHCDLPLIKDTNLKYLHLPTNDDNSKKGIDWFGPGIEFALNALVLPKNKIYIHCQAGINRAPSMTFAILLAQGIDSINARRLIKEVRPEVGLLYRYDAEKAVKLLEYV